MTTAVHGSMPESNVPRIPSPRSAFRSEISRQHRIFISGRRAEGVKDLVVRMGPRLTGTTPQRASERGSLSRLCPACSASFLLQGREQQTLGCRMPQGHALRPSRPFAPASIPSLAQYLLQMSLCVCTHSSSELQVELASLKDTFGNDLRGSCPQLPWSAEVCESRGLTWKEATSQDDRHI